MIVQTSVHPEWLEDAWSQIYLERYRNEGTRTYSIHADYTEADEPYRPNAHSGPFLLPAFDMPRDQMRVYTANPPRLLSDLYLGDEKVLFFIHPQVLAGQPDEAYVRRTLSIGTPQEGVLVSPSASTRTLYVAEGDLPHAVKVHFPFRISRYGRRMRDEVVAQAVALSMEMESGIGRMDDRFAFLREVIGITHRNLDPDFPRGEHWGYLVRDMQPFPSLDRQRRLIPGFALYGRDFFAPEKPLLLFELIGGKDPLSFVLSEIMLPIIRHWVDCFLQFGFLLEPHGQNVLLEIDDQMAIERIVHRDLSLGIDMRRRRHLNLANDHLNGYNRIESDSFCSITYDKFMGGHFFDRLVAACQVEHPNLSAEDFRQPCRREFARRFCDHRRYLPKTVHYFSESRDRFDKPLFKDTGEAPVWRP